MSRKGEVLTLRLRIEDEAQAAAIWEAIKGKGLVAGCSVRAIAWGNLFEERDLKERRFEYAKKLLERSGAYEELDILDRMERMDRRIKK